MKLIFRAMSRYKGAIALAILVKLIGTLTELTLPYILEHMIDVIVPTGNLPAVIAWGMLMFVAAVATRILNVKKTKKALDKMEKTYII